LSYTVNSHKIEKHSDTSMVAQLEFRQAASI